MKRNEKIKLGLKEYTENSFKIYYPLVRSEETKNNLFPTLKEALKSYFVDCSINDVCITILRKYDTKENEI